MITSRPLSILVDSVQAGVPSARLIVKIVCRKLVLLDATTLVVVTTSLSGRKDIVRIADHNCHVNEPLVSLVRRKSKLTCICLRSLRV